MQLNDKRFEAEFSGREGEKGLETAVECSEDTAHLQWSDPRYGRENLQYLRRPQTSPGWEGQESEGKSSKRYRMEDFLVTGYEIREHSN
jgi:hypothetical protein